MYNAQLQASMRNSRDDLNDKDAPVIEAKQLQAGIFVELLEMDRKLAMDLMTACSDRLEYGHSKNICPFVL